VVYLWKYSSLVTSQQLVSVQFDIMSNPSHSVSLKIYLNAVCPSIYAKHILKGLFA